jgi:gliding-associated putative ABC transporter substrate-binding component GldG
MRSNIQHIVIVLFGLLILNSIATKFYFRWDLTADKRYTLSKTTKNLLNKIDENVLIKVYLKGDFPLDFKRLEQETKQHLEELQAYNKHIHFRFINPSGIEEKLIKKGLQPSRLTIEKEGSISETLLFPWATISYKDRKADVPLLVNSIENQEKQLQNSIENLEFSFSEALDKVIRNKRKTIAVLKGNGELADIYLYNFLKSLKEKYNLAPFSLHDASKNPNKVLNDLKKYDLCLIAKPTKAFSEVQKFILDQYIINNGKTLWLIDNATAEMDSLQQTGEALFTPRDLNITDLLFSYGVRINYNLVQDLYSSKIALATGNIGDKTQFQQFLWSYYPLVNPNSKHPITKNLEAINLKFPSGIDTLTNSIKKSILLQSSPLTKVNGLPTLVNLNSIADKVRPELFSAKPQIFGCLLEGEFTSAFANRTEPFVTQFKEKSRFNKIIVISDGDIIANQILNGQPTRLDIDKWTGQHFGNKDFLLNSIDYLLDDSGLIDIRGKKLDIKLLNKEKVATEKGFWQFINIILPLLLLVFFGSLYSFIRKRKYA